MHIYKLRAKEIGFLALFFALQFFWLTASFANSETSDRVDDRGDRGDRNAIVAPAPPAPTPPPAPHPPPPPPPPSPQATPALSPSPPRTIGMVPDIPSLSPSISPVPSVTTPREIIPDANNPSTLFQNIVAFADMGGDLDIEGDLGHQIKFCIVFPILQSAGIPVGQGKGECPISTSTPPSSAPRLSVLKVVVNDDGGVGTVSQFQLRLGSTNITSGVVYVLSACVYQISEATTTARVGTTTTQYVQTFSGACSSSGMVTLSQGDSKVCILTNNDAGPGAAVTPTPSPSPGPGGGSTDVSPSPSPGGGGSGPTTVGGGGGGPPSGGGGGGSPSPTPTPPGIIAGVTTPPGMGGYIPEVPNTGAGGSASAVILALILSLTP